MEAFFKTHRELNFIKMELEEILQKYIEVKKILEGNELLVAAGLVYIDGSKELKMADALLAKTTKADADLLAKTTKADAEILAQATERAATELRKSNESSVRWMTMMTVAMLVVGLIQLIIASMSFFKI